MKKIIFILMLALTLFSCKSYKPASGNPYYKPLKEFKGDTLAYFNYNFKEHKDFYIGKKFSVLINDMGNKSIVLPDHRYLKVHMEDVMSSANVFLEPFGNGLFYFKDFTEYVNVRFDEGSYLKSKDYFDYKHKIEEEVSKEKNVALPFDETLYREKYFLSDCIIKDMSVFRFEITRPKNRR